MGLGFELENICFSVTYDKDPTDSKDAIRGTATASIYKQPRKDWKFNFLSLDARHIMAVAIGPIADAIDSYRSLAWPGEERFAPMAEEILELPASSSRTLHSLLREHELEIYRRACFLPTHQKEVCACCTPVPFDPKLGDNAFNGPDDDENFAGFGGINEDDVLVTGTPLPRTPYSPYLPSTPAFLRPPDGFTKPQESPAMPRSKGTDAAATATTTTAAATATICDTICKRCIIS